MSEYEFNCVNLDVQIIGSYFSSKMKIIIVSYMHTISFNAYY